MTASTDSPATTPTEIREALFEESVRLTDAQLLVLVLGMASDAGTDDYQLAIQRHSMFEALCEDRDWTHPAEVLGEPVPFAPLLSIAESRIDRAVGRVPRILRVRELLAAAERVATREPLIAFVTALLELEISESGLEKVFEEARRRYSRS